MKKILVINGPNINFLGIREKHVYGEADYETLVKHIQDFADKLGIEVGVVQSNHEGEIIDFIQQAHLGDLYGIVINPGAFTHYSYAIHDAIASVDMPVIEVHLSNIYSRESFRQHSVTAKPCKGLISGMGFDSYTLALQALNNLS